jgi:hypothetical protein
LVVQLATGNDGHVFGQFVVVDAINEGWGFVVGRRRDDDAFGSADGHVDGGIGFAFEAAGAFEHEVNAVIRPFDQVGIGLSEHGDGLAFVDDGFAVVGNGSSLPPKRRWVVSYFNK